MLGLKMFGGGRITSEPQLREISSPDSDKQTCVVNFSIVTNESRKVGNEKVVYSSFFDCEAWDSGARIIVQYHKGDIIHFLGRPRQNRWEKDGQKKSRVVFRIDEFTITPKQVRPQEDEKPGVEVEVNSGSSGDDETPF